MLLLLSMRTRGPTTYFPVRGNGELLIFYKTTERVKCAGTCTLSHFQTSLSLPLQFYIEFVQSVSSYFVPSLHKLDPKCVGARNEEGSRFGARISRRILRGDDPVLAEDRDEGDLRLVHCEPPSDAHPRSLAEAQIGAPSIK